jgi:hypothetical protein
MSIDPNSECILSLAEAASTLPRRRAGKRPHVSCIYRWTTIGCKGIVLESIQIGCTRCTSREAMARFFRRLTQGDTADLPPVRTSSQRECAAAQVIRDLELAGI